MALCHSLYQNTAAVLVGNLLMFPYPEDGRYGGYPPIFAPASPSEPKQRHERQPLNNDFQQLWGQSHGGSTEQAVEAPGLPVLHSGNLDLWQQKMAKWL